jgi:hypothetical protein
MFKYFEFHNFDFEYILDLIILITGSILWFIVFCKGNFSNRILIEGGSI